MAPCKICGSSTRLLFQKVILGKYPSGYYKCDHCGFMQTDPPVWIDEAYSSAITALDIGLVDRNLALRDQVAGIIDYCFPESKKMIDYGGGYGLFVRMMRDRGYEFFRQDTYCENLFAKHFDLTDLADHRFDLMTSFEVFEHFEHPMQEIEKMFKLAPTILFSTVLLPAAEDELPSWWYISEETGQHLAFYNRKTLECIARNFNKQLYTNGHNLHILTDKLLNPHQVKKAFQLTPAEPLIRRALRKLGLIPARRPSLTQSDYDSIKAGLAGGKN